MILEYCKHGNLQGLMKKGKIRMDRVRALRLLRDICMGLQHLNEAGISHRDVKSSNILLQCSHCPHTDGTMCLKDARSNLVAKLAAQLAVRRAVRRAAKRAAKRAALHGWCK